MNQTKKGGIRRMSYLNHTREYKLMITDGTDIQEVSTQDSYPNEMVAMTTALKCSDRKSELNYQSYCKF